MNSNINISELNTSYIKQNIEMQKPNRSPEQHWS